MISICHRHDELEISPKYGLGGGPFGTGRQFVPENFESYNKSLDEIYKESLEDDMYLLDISGVTFSARITGSIWFSARKSHCKTEKIDGEYIRYYIGSENVTEDNNPCLNWMNVTKAQDLIGIAGVGDHNFCRKPISKQGSREICYVSQTKTENCKVRSCGNRIFCSIY